MGNSTFSGPVRSENNFDLVSKNTTTGLIQNRTLGAGINDARRYYLKEWFQKKFGQGTIFDLDYGKLIIIALCIYIAFIK